jgi:hypothetical protein
MEANQTRAEATVLCEDDPLDLVLRSWSELAATAWEGYLTLGRGWVHVIPAGENISATYFPGPPCPCHPETVREYDPETQAVIAVQSGDAEEDFALHVLGGWPAPPEAFATVPAEALGEVVH